MATTHFNGPVSSANGFVDTGSTTSTLGTATISNATITNLQRSFAAITAGTTQTQAGATAVSADIVRVTVGTASDGIILPALSTALIGRTYIIINASANAGKLYGTGATSTNTIDGTAGATGVALTASKTTTVVAVSATAWVTFVSA